VQGRLLLESWRFSVRRVLTQVVICPRIGSLQTNCRTFCLTPFTNIACDDNSYLYTLFLAVDANFKLKRKNRGIEDLELAPGWASFVEEGRYQDHLKKYVDQPEVWVHFVRLASRSDL
jgi:hypothetical protein